MIRHFTNEQLENSKFKDKLPLECMECHSIFYKTKKRILQSDYPDNPLSGGFCSSACWRTYSYKQCSIVVNCAECGKELTIYKTALKPNNFCSHTCSATYFNRPRKKVKIKTPRYIKPVVIVKCKHCGQDTTNASYCNGTCRNKDQNKFKNGSRSYAEQVLSTKLKLNFPKWNIVENDRTILGGLELDIYIPELKLAIEWNGIYHILPIKGNEALQKILHKDGLKQNMCAALGITLISISDRTSHKKFIEETTNDLVEKLKQLELATRIGNAPTLTD